MDLAISTDKCLDKTKTQAGEREAAVCLSLVHGVGPRTHQALLDYFGSAQAVLQASTEQLLRVHGVGTEIASAITQAYAAQSWRDEIAYCEQHNIAMILRGSPEYPRLLSEIYDPPTLLYVDQSFAPTDHIAIAIVGTRHATSYGANIAKQLSLQLARSGVTVVSGLARGIDAAAHQGALAGGGRTIAVLAHGLSTIYPAEHKELADEIAQSGALVSECAPSVNVQRGGFPRRNRIISGLALGVVVIEAGDRSGALITARLAMEQGREVYAVPGRIDSRVSRGCHALLRDGAHLVESADDILDQLGPLIESTPDGHGGIIHHPAELLLNDQERAVLQAVTTEPTAIDAIIVTTGLPASRVLSTISALEMRRLLRRVSGHTVVRNFVT
jgi:DNA processing protein